MGTWYYCMHADLSIIFQTVFKMYLWAGLPENPFYWSIAIETGNEPERF